jgi:hypothetical protein
LPDMAYEPRPFHRALHVFFGLGLC